MRIAIDCRSVFPGMGGIGKHAAELVKALARTGGRDTYLLLFTGRMEGRKLVENPSFAHLYFEAGMTDERWEQLHLPSVLAECEVDLYHSTCFALPVVRTTRVAIAAVHDVVFRARPELVEPRLRDYLDRWTEHSLEAADAVITVSKFSKAEMVRLYGVRPEKVHVIYNGVGLEFFQAGDAALAASVREKYKLPKRFILYLGALEAKKNIDRLLEAYVLLSRQRRMNDVHLVLAGGKGGQGYDVRAALRTAGLEERATLCGYVSDEHVVMLMQLAELFVYPSLYEGFGLPPLEAMACGVPTVVSDATSLPEVVGDGALVSPAEDAGCLAEEMAKGLFDRGLRASLAKRGRARAREFTWERSARETAGVYEAEAMQG